MEQDYAYFPRDYTRVQQPAHELWSIFRVRNNMLRLLLVLLPCTIRNCSQIIVCKGHVDLTAMQRAEKQKDIVGYIQFNAHGVKLV